MRLINYSALALALAASSMAHGQSFVYNYSLGTGDIPDSWQKTDSAYGEWEKVGNPYGCSNWSPSPSSQGKGLAFIQSANDCKQDEKRTAQDYIRSTVNGQKKPFGDPYTEERTVNATDAREAIGILENWIKFDPSYSSWVDTDVLYGCTAWSPDPSIYSTTTNFTQTSNTCKTDQERQRQEREQEKYTSEIRDSGAPITEQQTLASQSASRPYSVTLGIWTDVGQSYACSNWSPDVDTIGKGVSFSQSATDCKLDQTRTRSESFKDHKNNTVVPVAKANENRTLTNQSGNRSAIGTLEEWKATTSTYTAWTDTNSLYGCSGWTPLPSSKTSTVSFAQSANDCSTDQVRSRQDREEEKNTGAIRNKGTPVTETQTLNAQLATRSYTVTLGAWTNSGSKYGCTNWSPAPSTVTMGQNFTQTASDCEQDQTRTRAESYVDHKSGSTVAVSTPAETQTLTGQTHNQTAVGTKESWVAATPTYTGWVNSNALYNCTNWSPAPSTKTATATYAQTATDCKTDQTRNRQDREQEVTTLVYRNKGAPVAENQTLSAQTATRSYTVTLGAWTDSGAKYGCTNWSPSPATVTLGQNFTQTATDCEQNQTRTRAESYVDHKSGSTVAVSVPAETQVLMGQTSTQTAKGTKETWVAAAPTYTAWTDSNALYGCSVWEPKASIRTTTSTFYQLASDCKTDQTRNRQEREQETTTLVFRNKGTAVVEAQTLSNQDAVRSYTVTLGDWANTGYATGCSNLTPDPSTVPAGEVFTQTGTNCTQNQTRTRAESYIDHKTASIVNVPVPAETRTLTGQNGSMQATGTKGAWSETVMYYGPWTVTKAAYNCSVWSPPGNLMTNAGTYNQYATDCKEDRTRNVQRQEYNSVTGEYRLIGTPTVENNTFTNVTGNRPYTVTFGTWTNIGAAYGCTNWSPATSTVTSGQSFTQIATDCKQDTQRTRTDYYIDNVTGRKTYVYPPSETRTLPNQASSRSAIGTK